MKTKNIVVSVVLIIVVASIFGYRYWFVPNFVMPKRVPVAVIQKPKPVVQKTVVEEQKTEDGGQKAEDGGQKTEDGEQKIVTVVKEQPVTKKPEPVKEFQKSKAKIQSFKNLLKNSLFKTGKENWGAWQHAKNQPENITIIDVENNKNFDSALRIENPKAVLIGLQQLASLKSGTVYRLSGAVRSTQSNDNKKIFGGRIAIFLPPQKEKDIVWMSEYNKWWEKELIFTNQVSGVASIFVHMGYGGVSSTGEFANIKLEKLGN